MIKLPGATIDVEGNVLKAEFKLPFIPPSKQNFKEKYKPFNDSIEVEKDRLLQLYKILTDTLEGKPLEETFILQGTTDGKKAVVLLPQKYLSENAKAKGGIYGIKFQSGFPEKDDVVFSGRAVLSLTMINLFRNLIKTKGSFGYAFSEVDETGKSHCVVIERDKGNVIITYPRQIRLSDTKKAKLQLAIKSYLAGVEKVPTTIVNDRAVFRKANTGKFTIHTSHHSIGLNDEDLKRLQLIVED